MSKNKIGEDSPIPKFIYLKIRRRDGVESLTTLEEGEFKVPIDGCINGTLEKKLNPWTTYFFLLTGSPISWSLKKYKNWNNQSLYGWEILEDLDAILYSKV